MDGSQADGVQRPDGAVCGASDRIAARLRHSDSKRGLLRHETPKGRPSLRKAAPLAHLGGESSKLLFDTLAQWNHALSQTSIAGILAAANSNDVAHDDESSSNGGSVPLDPNVVGIDLSARRPQRPTYRGPKKRHSGDDAMEVGQPPCNRLYLTTGVGTPIYDLKGF